MSSDPPKPASTPADRIGPDILTYSYTACDQLAQHPQNSAYSSLGYPSRSMRNHHFRRHRGERCDPAQSLSVDAGFEHDSPRNGKKAIGDGLPTIPAACRPPESDKVHAKIPPTNGGIIPKDSTSLVMPVMPQACVSDEDIGIEPARAESPPSESSPRPHHPSISKGALAATSPPRPPRPPALGARPGEAATKVGDAPLRRRNGLGYMIIKHRKMASTASIVLTTVGDIVLSPGFPTCVSGTVLAHPAVIVAGAIAGTFGRWLRSALNSTEASAAARVQPSDEEAV